MPTMPNNFSGGCFERQMCAAKWVLSKRGLPTRCLVTGQSSVERESSVELLHFCDNQTPLVVHTISFYLMRAIHPYLFLTGSGGIWVPPSLAVFLHKPSGSPYLFFVHICHQVFHLPLSIQYTSSLRV